VAEAKSLRDPDTLFLAVPFLRIMVTDGISATVPEELDRQLRNAGLARTAPGKPVYEWADICGAGERLLKQGNPAAALFFFNIAKDRTPGDYRPWLQLGMLSRKAREFQAAEYFLRQALVKEPKNEMVRKNLAELYRETGHPAAALAILTSA